MPDHHPAPPAALSPARTRRTMRLSILEGAFSTFFLNVTTGSVLTGYLLHLGARPTDLALVASVPLLAQVISPFAAALAAHFGLRKPLTVLAVLIGRLIWLLAALLPQLGLPEGTHTAALVLIVAVSSLFQAAAGSLWSAWMADVVPARRRGRYFGLRNGLLGLVGLSANFAAGAFLDRAGAPLGFQVVLGVAVTCALIGGVLLHLHDDTPQPPQPARLRDTLRAPWQDRNFRRVLTFGGYWQFSVLLAGPFVFPYFLSALHMTFTQIAVFTAIAGVCALITSWWWGKVADHAGNKPVLKFGTILCGVALPGTWILAGLTGRLEFIWLSAVLDAVAWGAITSALFNLALGAAPARDRTAFYAMFSLVAGVTGCAGALLAGPLLAHFTAHATPMFGLPWTGYHSLFALSGLLRVLAHVLLARVQEPGEARLRDGVRTVTFHRPALAQAGD